MKEKTFLKGAFILSCGGFISKAIGAVYRVLLLGLIGATGMGRYQMIYPLYALLLTLSSAGIPSALSGWIAERGTTGEGNALLFRKAIKAIGLIGAIGTIGMLGLAPLFSFLQGGNLAWGYVALAPAVFLVAIIAVFRGYLQGKSRMLPTAVSEVIEQSVKVALGLLVAYLYRGDLEKLVPMLLFAVTISEGVALLYLWGKVRKTPREKGNEKSLPYKSLLKRSVPVTVSCLLLPVCTMIESVLIVRLLAYHTSEGVRLYGLFSGGVVSLVQLSSSVCYGFAVATIPTMSATSDVQLRRKKGAYAVGVTAIFGGLFTLGLLFFAPIIVKILFSSLDKASQALLVRLIRLSAPSAILLPITQTLASCLTGQGKAKIGARNMAFAVAVRLLLDFLLIGRKKFSIYGAVIASNVGYLVAFFLDLVYNLIITKRKGDQNDYGSEPWDSSRGFDGKGETRDLRRGRGACAHRSHKVLSNGGGFRGKTSDS